MLMKTEIEYKQDIEFLKAEVKFLKDYVLSVKKRSKYLEIKLKMYKRYAIQQDEYGFWGIPNECDANGTLLRFDTEKEAITNLIPKSNC